MENDKIQAIQYKEYERVHGHDLDHALQLCKIVSNVKQLRYLSVWIRYPKSCVVAGPNFLSNELCYFEWDGYPVKNPFPVGFQPVKLGVLKLSESFQKEIWKGCKHLPHLKVLQLSKMRNLLKTPNFDGLPCLQNLRLEHCPKLAEIHQSLGNHTSLQYVSVLHCDKLRKFPTITHMENLKNLDIWNCPKIHEFPKIQANMEGLLSLYMRYIGIKVLPSSIEERCTNLISLELSSYNNIESIQFKFHALKHLKELNIRRIDTPCEDKPSIISSISTKVGSLYSLFQQHRNPSKYYRVIQLTKAKCKSQYFSRLAFSLSQFTQLKLLNVSNCEKLLELPELPSSLSILNASNCKSLTALGDCYKNCRWLSQVSLKGAGRMIINDGDSLLKFMLDECMANENHYMLLQLSGVKIAKGFTPSLVRESRCTLQLPENWCNDFSGFLMWVVTPNRRSSLSVEISMNEEMHGMYTLHDHVFWDESDSDTSIMYVSFGSLRETKWWDQTYRYKALGFKVDYGCYGFGVRLIGKKSRGGITATEASTNHSCGYTPNLWIKHDSRSALSILFPTIDDLEHISYVE
ncbi:hypothetical protein QVD17_02680 [Tagetes erecta]|uniref:Uncharacterized protein n=1 Tax=Tagetes erecta TaxID=13708 RepID=A0AAD8LCY2_TARER|nr:hypothetical protein QVD17_02680 [Tagetes erecta]